VAVVVVEFERYICTDNDDMIRTNKMIKSEDVDVEVSRFAF